MTDVLAPVVRVCDGCGREVDNAAAVAERWRYVVEVDGNERLLCDGCLRVKDDARPVWHVRNRKWLLAAGAAIVVVVAYVAIPPHVPAIGTASTEAFVRSFDRVYPGGTDGECMYVRVGRYSCTIVFDPGSGFEGPFDVRRSGNCWVVNDPIANSRMRTRGCAKLSDQLWP